MPYFLIERSPLSTVSIESKAISPFYLHTKSIWQPQCFPNDLKQPISGLVESIVEMELRATNMGYGLGVGLAKLLDLNSKADEADCSLNCKLDLILENIHALKANPSTDPKELLSPLFAVYELLTYPYPIGNARPGWFSYIIKEFLTYSPDALLTELMKSNHPKAKEIYHHLVANFKNNRHFEQEAKARTLLAHRFSLGGKTVILGSEHVLDGGIPQVMVEEMQNSFKGYAESLNASTSLESISKLGLSPNVADLKETLRFINSDLQAVQFDAPTATISSMLANGRVVNIAVTADSPISPFTSMSAEPGKGKHSFTIGFYKNFMIYSDRSRKMPNSQNMDDFQGMEIFEVQNSAELESLARFLMDTDNQIGEVGTAVEILEKLKKKLHARSIGRSEEFGQLAGNCSWESNASMMVRATAFCHFYNKGLEAGLDKQAAQASAIKAAEMLHRNWVAYDQEQFLKSYLEKVQNNENPIKPDTNMLAQIYVRNKNLSEGQRIKNLIDKSKLIDKTHEEKAYKQSKEQVKKFIIEDLERSISNKIFVAHEDEINSIVEKYLFGRYIEAESEYEALVEVIATQTSPSKLQQFVGWMYSSLFKEEEMLNPYVEMDEEVYAEGKYTFGL